MRLGLWLLIIGSIGAVFNAAFIRSIWPDAPTPDFCLMLTVAIALYIYSPIGAVLSFFLGLMADFSSAQFLGPNAAGCVLAFTTVGLIANRMYAEKWLAVMIICFICSMVKTGVYLGFLALYFQTNSSEDLSRTVILEAVFTACLSPLVIGVLSRQALYSLSNKAAKYGTSATGSLGTSSSIPGRWSANSRLHWT